MLSEKLFATNEALGLGSPLSGILGEASGGGARVGDGTVMSDGWSALRTAARMRAFWYFGTWSYL
jgi:hypothetical protein